MSDNMKHLEGQPVTILMSENDTIQVNGFKYKIIKSGKLDTRSFEPLMQLKKVE